MSYAIIQLAGKQFKVLEGQTITTDRLTESSEGDTITVTDVLLIADEKTSKIGTPLVKGAEVTLKVVEHNKGKKIDVLKYKSKSRYRKTYGHRSYQSKLEVLKIKA